MGLWQNLTDMNPFSKYFIQNKEHSDITREHFEDENAQAVSAQEYENLTMYGGAGSSGYDQQYIDFNPTLETKKGRIQTYREMALSPEINDGVSNIVNDATQPDAYGFIYNLKFTERSDKEIPEVIKQRMRNAWEYLYYEILDFNVIAQEWWKRFLIDGEVYTEWVLNDKGTNIIGYQVLPAFTMAPIYSERGTRIKGYVQLLKDVVNYSHKYTLDQRQDALLFQSNQISYAAYPGPRGNSRLDIRGYLETSIRIWNLLRSVEDAVVVYRLVRAPERRVWNIYTAGLPPAKASEYINGLQKKYKKKLIYNSGDGTTDQTQNVQSILEDFWFAKDQSGVTSTVETLQSGMNLGEITDLDYLQKKLYKSLNLPASRWADQATAQYTGGKIGEVTREEVRFSKFITNLTEVFKPLLRDPFYLLCKMRGIEEKYITAALVDIVSTKSNHFEDYLDNDIITTKLNVLTTVTDKIWSPDNLAGLFHPITVLEDLCGFSQTFIEKNQKRIDDALKSISNPEVPPETPPEEGEVPPETPPEGESPVEETLPSEADESAVEAEAASAPEATPGGMGMQSGEASDFEA